MSESFYSLLDSRCRQIDSLLCIGLDPRPASHSAVEAREACFRLIDQTAELVCAFKPNSAFFEALGPEGMRVLQEVIAHVPEGIPVILDAKRGDIADTAAAYARAAFEVFGAHAVTLSPYLGGDALAPFLADPTRGVFVLCKTSNPGADEFQSVRVLASPGALSSAGEGAAGEGDLPLFEFVARRALAWNAHGNVGLVVGATDAAALARVRKAAPDLWFLLPGIGAQGGDMAAALQAGLRADGLGLVVNVARSVASAADPRAEAKRLRDAINDERSTLNVERSKLDVQRSTFNVQRSALARALVASGCVKFGRFTLKSGAVSPIYLDLRRLASYPTALAEAAAAYARLLEGLAFDRLAGIPYAALPIATAIALRTGRPMIYPRREVKEYGTKAQIEGEFHPGETAVVIDDLATTGGSKVEAIEKLQSAGLKVRDVVVLIDREQGARESLSQAGYRLHAVTTLRQLLPVWQRLGAVSEAQVAEVEAFIAGTGAREA